jgi:hypothetical protein
MRNECTVITTVSNGDWTVDSLQKLAGLLNGQLSARQAKLWFDELPRGDVQLHCDKKLPMDIMMMVINYTQGFLDGFSIAHGG